MTTAKPRRKKPNVFPVPHHMKQAEAWAYLGRQVLEDAVDAKWLKPSTRKPEGGSVFYAFRDVEMVSLRIAAGEYPTPV